MKIIKNIKRSFLVIVLIASVIFLLTQCINNTKTKNETATTKIKNVQDQQFAGSIVCAKCHQSIYETHIHTAHYLTSRPAHAQYIKGSFEEGKNTFAFNPYVIVAAEKTDSAFYQVEYINGIAQRRERFDIVTGSGKRGQTYLYWNDNNLFQLPMFYFATKNEWANSPGYPGKVIFNRQITSRCLECHSTYVQKISDAAKEPEEFDSSKIIYGVDCEKCHGPGERHVEYQFQNPNETKGKYIINPVSFSRKQNLNLCALCHGGRLFKTKPSFSFEAGDTLSNYFSIDIDTLGKNAADIDVHGNQYGLLAASQCFKMSEMTCTTCHNPHENETGKVELFSQRCMTCHNTEHGNFCKLNDLSVSVLKQNCIDCHMPELPSKNIVFIEQGSKIPAKASMRSHYIKIYPKETKKVMQPPKSPNGER